MKATVCDRCGKIVPYSDDEEYFVEFDIPTSTDCELIGISERDSIELCGKCTEELKKFMTGKKDVGEK
jgi:hypothetical protein